MIIDSHLDFFMIMKLSPSMLQHFKGYCTTGSVILMFVYMKLKYSLSYRDLEDMMSMRGASVDHSTLQRWVFRFSKLIEKRVRSMKNSVSKSWRMDETYIKLNGKWVYLYRAVDKYGNTVDFLLRAKRDAVAAKAFFKKAINNNERPEKVTVDKSGSNKTALDACNKGIETQDEIEIRQIKYLNNIVEQDHRFIKKRIKLMLGFKNFNSARNTIGGIESIHMIHKQQTKNYDSSKSVFCNFVTLMETCA